MHTILTYSSRVLFVSGIAGLLCWSWIIADSRHHQNRAFAQLLQAKSGATRQLAVNTTTTSQGQGKSEDGSVVGLIEIPRIGLSAVIDEGDSSQVLRRAVGHIPGTAPPGQPGNVALAAHRDTFFRQLGILRHGDEINLVVPGGHFNYVVEFSEVVDPIETWILQAATGQTLTLITCFPFHYIGAAPKRYMVRARRVV